MLAGPVEGGLGDEPAIQNVVRSVPVRKKVVTSLKEEGGSGRLRR